MTIAVDLGRKATTKTKKNKQKTNQLFAFWVILHGFLVSSADFFFKINFLGKSLSGIPSAINSLGPDQARRYYLQRLSAKDTIMQC